MQLSEWGELANDSWKAIPEHFSHVWLDTHIVMPNHVHGILIIKPPVGVEYIQPLQGKTKKGNQFQHLLTPSAQITWFHNTFIQVAVTREIHRRGHLHNQSIWQRNYYDHIHPVRYFERYQKSRLEDYLTG